MALVPVLLLCVAALAFGSSIHWETVRNATPDATGGRNSPAIRYSHASAATDKQVIITHGYYYDAASGDPKWLSDTWALSSVHPYRWQKLHGGITQREALKAHTSKQQTRAPCGRYGATTVIHQGTLYMFGGTDGGHSKHGKPGYEQGYDMDELWKFDIKKRSWSSVSPPKDSLAWPAARYLHTAVLVGSQMLIYGGNGAALGDVWSFDLDTQAWSLLVNTTGFDAGGPGSLFAASAVPDGEDNGFLLFGGRRFGAAMDELSPDVWHFRVSTRRWQKLEARAADVPKPVPGSKPQSAHTLARLTPAPRFYSAMASVFASAATDGLPTAIMSAGSTHTPTMECTDETWSVSWDLKHMLVLWRRLPTLPYGIYYHSLSVSAGSAFVFGGHLCSDTRGDMPFFYLNTVHRLDLSTLQTASKANKASEVDRELLRLAQ